MTKVKVGTRFQVVVPREAREALKLSPGDRLKVGVEGNAVVMLIVRAAELRARASIGFAEGLHRANAIDAGAKKFLTNDTRLARGDLGLEVQLLHDLGR
ncbi:MAG: AbrB/MazE/SpoVT family DNA-binding domain-containing protein [Trueperaceae bacterium]